MKIGEALKHLQVELGRIYDKDESLSMAQILLEDCTGCNRSNLLLARNEALPLSQVEKLEAQLTRLLKYEPVQYVLNKAPFYGLNLYVDKGVLIPRPETEELVHWIVADVKGAAPHLFERSIAQADQTTQLKILDIGTGSGCIALALKKSIPKAEVWGCDVSEEALNVARRNGADLNIRVDFQGINFLDEAQQKLLPTVDLIVSNPPYIPASDKATMQPNVLHYEPHTALFVPNDDALLFYKSIAKFAKKRLYAHGAIYLEIHEDLGSQVVDLFTDQGFAVELRKDMQEKERMIKAYRKEQSRIT